MACIAQSMGLHGASGYPVSAVKASCVLSAVCCPWRWPQNAPASPVCSSLQAARFSPNGPAATLIWLPCQLDEGCQELILGAYERRGLAAHSYGRILRMVRTIANLDWSDAIQLPHLAEALQYRPPEYFSI